MHQDLQFNQGQQAGEVLVSGPLDRNSVAAGWGSRKKWLPSGGQVTLDLAQVEQVDSAGLAMLIRLQAELSQGDRELSLRNVNKQLQQFAAVSGVTQLLSLS
ncbi:anti-sigma B factor antagonist [Aliidiomarina minuta]|uniref:Anti-sigma B factor antagonist n=1 Tax=Aliidiomarina minuta TaxID=880057 RepID=A0A432W918_9GAMM|nr:STAS domain-containing protein [Aliidiomarina minuta]RUO26647.1 anti-sigma B factor antagonist [Aliidiomarina minuta]